MTSLITIDKSTSEKVSFSFESTASSCGVVLRDIKNPKVEEKLPFLEKERVGNCYKKSIEIEKNLASSLEYQFYEDEQYVPDPYAKAFSGVLQYGKIVSEEHYWSRLKVEDFDWENDKFPNVSSQDALWYQLNVRGFTKNKNSGVSAPGTFLGIQEKIPYLYSLGMTTIELLPAYEFVEYDGEKLNYWGFKQGFYYAPKRSYSAGDSVLEFKQLVKELHKNKLELVMQFYFDEGFDRARIIDILSYWRSEYHVDGFHVMGNQLDITYIANSPMLVDCKLIFDSLPGRLDKIPFRVILKNEKAMEFSDSDRSRSSVMLNNALEYPIYATKEHSDYAKDHIGLYRDEFLYDGRRLLRGDDDCLVNVLRELRDQGKDHFSLRFLSNYWGFTLMDMVSFDRKHNEENGENNHDGSDNNCSWNCGEEGKSRKKKVIELRKRQIKNALSLLFLNASVPLIYMGDEFGNSRKGNNNPYCIDNKTTWLDWKDLDRNQDIYQYFQAMVLLRKDFSIIKHKFSMMDELSLGYPDLSYHGESAWKGDWDFYSHQIGLLYCDQYKNKERAIEDSLLYVAINLNWIARTLALPKPPKGAEWKQILSTDDSLSVQVSEEELTCMLPARTICFFQCVKN